MSDEHDVLDWMVMQKEDESIELIDMETLNKYITTKDFLAVVFCKIFALNGQFGLFKLNNF